MFFIISMGVFDFEAFKVVEAAFFVERGIFFLSLLAFFDWVFTLCDRELLFSLTENSYKKAEKS